MRIAQGVMRRIMELEPHLSTALRSNSELLQVIKRYILKQLPEYVPVEGELDAGLWPLVYT